MMLTPSSVESDAQWSKEMREEIALPLFFRHVASRFLRQAKTKGVEVKLVSLSSLTPFLGLEDARWRWDF